MPDLAEQLVLLIDAVAPPVSVGEIRDRARSRVRRRSIIALSVGTLVAASAVIGLAAAGHHDRGRSAVRVTTQQPTGPSQTRPKIGERLGTLQIGAIGLRSSVFEGIDVQTLRKGPGHDPQSPLPGEPGHVVILGHRTTYDAPFLRLDALRPGNLMSLTTAEGTFHYSVVQQEVVNPNAVDSAIRTSSDSLVLVADTPKYTNLQRLLVFARSVAAP
jgi:sortase A